MKFAVTLSTLTAVACLAFPSYSSASVINSNTIPGAVIINGANGLEFVYGSVTSPDSPCCGIQVTLTQGFRLPNPAEMVGAFGTLTGLLGAFNLLDDVNENNIVAFEYFKNSNVEPLGDVGDVRRGFVNNLNMGPAFYDYAGSAFMTNSNSDFFFVRSQGMPVSEPTSLALIGLALAGLAATRKTR